MLLGQSVMQGPLRATQQGGSNVRGERVNAPGLGPAPSGLVLQGVYLGVAASVSFTHL